MPEHEFMTFRDEALPIDFYRVNAREWTSDWSDQWVAFVDLIGFASLCDTSAQTATNVLVRFHRCLNRAHQSAPSVRAFRFTDSAYFVSPDFVSLLRLVSSLQHLCLAVNSHLLERPHVLAQHFLIPRVTVAFGPVLARADLLGMHEEEPLDDVDSETFLAGSAIVAAYKAERKSAGSLVSLASDPSGLLADQDIRGNASGYIRTLFTAWADDPDWLEHDGVWDFPWLLLRPTMADDNKLWTDDRAQVLVKLEQLSRVWDLSFGSYVATRQPIETVKHFGAAQRHLSVLFQRVQGHTTVKRWSAATVRDRIRPPS